MTMMTALYLKNKETQYKLKVDLRYLRRLAREFYNKNYGSLNGIGVTFFSCIDNGDFSLVILSYGYGCI